MSLKELFKEKKTYIDYFFEKLDLSVAEKFYQFVRDCKGTRVFTGVGKSGLIAKKIAVTMTSTGSKALYISPMNALHGDIGMLNEEDVFIMLSKSGESDELLNLLPHLRNKRVRLLSIVSNPHSRLAKASDYFVNLPLEKELCPFNLAPTTSSSIQLIFGDVLAIALMKERSFSLDQYALNHPAGAIGKRLIVKVQDLMLTGEALPTCHMEDKVMDILVELSNKRSGCILIIDEQRVLKGIFTDGDLGRVLLKEGVCALEGAIKHVMTSKPRVITRERLAWEAMQAMEADQRHAITCMPVIDAEGRLQGLIRLHDIIQSGL